MSDSLFCILTCWNRISNFYRAHSRKYAQGFPLQLAKTVFFVRDLFSWKTTADKYKFATTCVLSMSKALTFETMQGIWVEGFNWYIKVTGFGQCRKDGYIEGIYPATACDIRFSQISSSLTPSKSLHLTTPFDEVSEASGVTLMGSFRRHLNAFRKDSQVTYLDFYYRFWITSQANNCLLYAQIILSRFRLQ